MTTQVFLDECKRDGYTVAAAALTHGRVDEARRTLRGLLMPKARSPHFQAESDTVRKGVLEAICELGVGVTIYQAARKRELDARMCILEQIVTDLAPTLVTRLEEPLLWVPDAVAWAYTKDKAWRARVEPVVATVVTL